MKHKKKSKTSLDSYREVRKPMPKPTVIHDNGKNKNNIPQGNFRNRKINSDDLNDFDDFDPEDLDF